jgi:hypothetical protein
MDTKNVGCYSELTRLVAQEIFIEFSWSESFTSYIHCRGHKSYDPENPQRRCEVYTEHHKWRRKENTYCTAKYSELSGITSMSLGNLPESVCVCEAAQ